jgi:hypothetical protein
VVSHRVPGSSSSRLARSIRVLIGRALVGVGVLALAADIALAAGDVVGRLARVVVLLIACACGAVGVIADRRARNGGEGSDAVGHDRAVTSRYTSDRGVRILYVLGAVWLVLGGALTVAGAGRLGFTLGLVLGGVGCIIGGYCCDRWAKSHPDSYRVG